MTATLDDEVAELRRANAELQRRLNEALAEREQSEAQKAAMAEIVEAINSSPDDLAPVFDALLEKAMRLCGAAFGALQSYDGKRFEIMAQRGTPPRFAQYIATTADQPGSNSVSQRLLRGERLVHVVDVAEGDDYQKDPYRRALVDLGGARTAMGVGLRKDDVLLGVIHIYRQEVQPFTEQQIALLQNFAAQAVIAMENARLLGELRQRTSDLEESLEYQTATSDVLQVISRSAFDLQPVLDTLVETAARLCEADNAIIFRLQEGCYHMAASVGFSPEFREHHAKNPTLPGRGTVTGRVAVEHRVVHIEDAAADPEYTATQSQQLGQTRTMLGVPLLREDKVTGVITLSRSRVEPFTNKQIELVTTFADQAVIAIENARLLTETREALEQQTATAEVLRVINSSPGDLVPVFEAILEKAHNLCGVAPGALVLCEGETFRAVATHSYSGSFAEQLREGYRGADNPITRALIDGEGFLHIPDLSQIDHPMVQASVENAGVRTGLYMPLRKDGVLLGMISSCRTEIRPFSDREIASLQNFAAQAVIAIENARLLTETREALEQQTATAQVLQVINSSPGELAPVFDAMLEKAVRLCDAVFGTLHTFDGDIAHVVAERNLPKALSDWHRRFRPDPERSFMGRSLHQRRTIHVADDAAEEPYRTGVPSAVAAVELGGVRTLLHVPLIKGNTALGVFTIFRQEVRPFSDKQIALLESFAAQAVIAMENARLLTETHEALEQQTATAEVLQVINSSPGDLAPVFHAMLAKAFHLCEGVQGSLWTFNGGRPRIAAAQGLSSEFVEVLREQWERRGPSEHHPMSRLMRGERVVQILDIAASDLYLTGDPAAVAAVELGRVRTLMFVALVKDDAPFGAFIIARREVRPFNEKQISLVENFAAQAVIAMENARLITETREALEQQTATAEVLQVINSSPGDLAPVFQTILEKAHALCDVAYGSLQLYDGEKFRAVAVHNLPERLAEQLRQGYSPGPRMQGLLAGEAFDHILDMAEVDDPMARNVVELSGLRTLLRVALRKDNLLLGQIVAARSEVRPFSDKQIALLQNFAAQAVIAMENARLITETREALEQQTATAEVLQVINSSPGDLGPVFDAILEKAHSLCGATQGILATFDGEYARAVATHGVSEPLAGLLHQPFRPLPNSPHARLVREQCVIHIPDLATETVWQPDDLKRTLAAEQGVRTMLFVPLRKDNLLLGWISANRLEARPFSEKEIGLLQNFAAQAVIAMENARLLNETRDALEQQTATAEVLQVINSSPGNLTPVFNAMLEKAIRVCDADAGVLLTYDGECFWPVAHRGLAEFPRDPILSHPERGSGRLARGEDIVHILDSASGAPVEAGDAGRLALLKLGAARTQVAAALRKEGKLLGSFTIWRREVRAFSDKQIALLQNFAAQAVIAMENARLLNEIRQRQAELRVTFDNMVDGVAMFDAELRLAAWNRNFQELLDLPDAFLAERHGFDTYIRYLTERGEFGETDPETQIKRLRARIGDHYSFERTRPDGTVIEVRHNPMPDGGIVLIYSDITERKRSEAEIRAARDAAEAAYRDLKAAQASLVQAEKMASLGQLTAGIAHEIKNPLNFVNNFAGLSIELLDELKETTAPAIAALGEDKRAEVDETITMLTGNLEKIAEHGRRADNIVKSMLEHSRGSSGERRKVDLNGLIEEALNLAYHGGRAQDQNFNITLERDYAQAMPPIQLVPQDITRVCLNLFTNGFYATTKRQREGSDASFKPTLKVSTRDLGDAVEVRIRDNGIGIPAEVKDKLFQPFFTTKPTGEGTGLGLSISYDIVTQQHGGTIEVDSYLGEYTEFTVRLPRTHRVTMAEAAS